MKSRRRLVAGEGIEPGERRGMDLLDVAPTVLGLFGLPRPGTMRGRSLLEMRPWGGAHSVAIDGSPPR